MPTLAAVVAAMERMYDPRWAASWDAVGLVCGDPQADVGKILFAVDPVLAVVDEALRWEADVLITHHPLLLTAVHGVPADDPKGRLIHRLIRAGCGLFVAHTNADVAQPGVSDALADALGLVDTTPLEPDPTETWDKITVFVPVEDAERVTDALAEAGAGRYGDYERCAWWTTGEGTFRPTPGANPTMGSVGAVERVVERRVEMVVPRARRDHVVRAVRAVHPYEEPAFDLVQLDRSVPATRGTGRVGRLARPMTLAEFVPYVGATLPATAAGVRAAGDPEMIIETVAVCGGSGGGYAEHARRAGADAYVTADLKHHVTSELSEGSAGAPALRRPMALVDVAHWASEWPWLDAAASRLVEALRVEALDDAPPVQTRVSAVVTDPWTLHAPGLRWTSAPTRPGAEPADRGPS